MLTPIGRYCAHRKLATSPPLCGYPSVSTYLQCIPISEPSLPFSYSLWYLHYGYSFALKSADTTPSQSGKHAQGLVERRIARVRLCQTQAQAHFYPRREVCFVFRRSRPIQAPHPKLYLRARETNLARSWLFCGSAQFTWPALHYINGLIVFIDRIKNIILVNGYFINLQTFLPSIFAIAATKTYDIRIIFWVSVLNWIYRWGHKIISLRHPLSKWMNSLSI